MSKKRWKWVRLLNICYYRNEGVINIVNILLAFILTSVAVWLAFRADQFSQDGNNLADAANSLGRNANNLAAESISLGSYANQLAERSIEIAENDKTQDEILSSINGLLIKNETQISELRSITLKLSRQLSFSLSDSATRFYVDSISAWQMLDNICDTVDYWAFFRSDTSNAGNPWFRSELKSKLNTVLIMASISHSNSYIKNTPVFSLIYSTINNYFRSISYSLTIIDPSDRIELYKSFEKFRDGQSIIRNLLMSCLLDGGREFDLDCVREQLNIRR